MKHRWSPLVLVPIVALAPVPAWPADASPAGRSARPAETDVVTLNFVNAEIEGVVKAVGEITGRNFVLDPRVKGTVNIVSARPLSRSMVYDVFLSALRVQGFAAVEDRGVVKIVPAADAKLYPSPTRGPQDGNVRSGGDRLETRVFTLKYESAAQLVPILRPLISPNNTINSYQGTNSLVITDYGDNLQRIQRIIDSIDHPNGTEPVVIPLRNASALDVAHTANKLFGEPAPGSAPAAEPGQRLTVIADARSNSLVVRSDNPSRLFRLRSLVAMLDTPTSAAGNIHVVHLKNADAVKLADTLRAIYLRDSAPATPAAGGLPAMAMGAPPPPPGAPLGTSVSPLSSPATSPLTGLSSSPSPAASAQGIIQADAATNSIIITASDPVYNSLRAALDKLDVRRAQVYVEALIAEVTADKAAEFGVQWQDLSGLRSTDNSAQAFGGTNFGNSGQNILGIAQSPLGAGRGLNVGVIKGRVTIPGIGEILNLGVLVRALETDNNANILSTPTLLTLDNEEARIVIGQNVPFITGQYALSGAATTPTPFQTIERRDVGLTLRIKPQISEGGTVRLQIYQEVSSVQDTSNPAGVITNKRSVESTVLVDDKEIVVIGGLIQDSVRDGVEKVPIFGDIPLLGALFQYKTRARSKTNLMVFLRPTVLRDSESAGSLTGERYEYIIGQQRALKPPASPPLPPMEGPNLPPRPAPAAPAASTPPNGHKP